MRDNPPDRIWLQYYGMDREDMEAEYGDDWGEAHEVSFCVDHIYDTDIAYRRTAHTKDLLAYLREVIEDAIAETEDNELTSLALDRKLERARDMLEQEMQRSE